MLILDTVGDLVRAVAEAKVGAGDTVRVPAALIAPLSQAERRALRARLLAVGAELLLAPGGIVITVDPRGSPDRRA